MAGLRRGRFDLVLLISVLATSALHAGQAGQDSRVEHGREFLGLAPPADPAAAARGKTLFQQNCAFCHGANATGAEGPDLVRSTIVLHDEKGETISPVVLKGRPDKGMPAFSTLTQAQIYDLAEFLHQRVEEAANRFGYKMQNIVTGDPKAGEAYFNGAGHCSSCHSPAGDLAHIARKFQPADLQSQFLYPAKVRDDDEDAIQARAVHVKITLPSGESVSGTLKRMDDFEISIWDASGSYRSWPRHSVRIESDDPLQAHRELLGKYTDTDMHNLLAYLETLK